ncbi:MAG: hypothetical protein GX107_01455, partial [Clostridiales bacterium]|nr:hypothetical protein [Clostridiales bacterium]
MKKAFKRATTFILAFILVFGGAPLGALEGLDVGLPGWLKSPLSPGASAAQTWHVGDIGTFGSYPQTIVTDVVLLTTL